ncbi:DUF1015 domain-containing protein [Desulfofalx alkaliphila]|uniref:DUF1015 domain-containing protein n=1 Tax=Desulfofalx alkaliphila TaxID=105483 RepID=UPI0004E14684|nr:DUF1015 domain-containing protein [Desulfofalx alkaliphila]
MATIVPIRGLRYNLDLVGDMSQVVTPPYDVISPAAQQQYYDKNPYNIIRLEYGKINATDTDTDNRYTRAAKTFNEWIEKKVLLQEEKPALYRYQQQYVVNGTEKTRTGFICGVKIEPYEKGVVLPHEETLPKHKADRLALMKACKANFSPIFGLYADHSLTIDKIIEEAAGNDLDLEFTDEEGITHRLTVIKDEEAIKKVQEAMEKQRIFIADGHHRYETSLNYRNYRREEEGLTGEPGDQAYDYVMMTLVNLYDPGLIILPTHRLVKNVANFNLSRLLEQLKEEFVVDPVPVNPDGSNIAEFLDQVYRKGGFDRGMGINHRRAFGLYAGGNTGYVVTLESEAAMDRLMPREKSLAWQGLDVSVLHTAILERLLGIGSEQRAKESNLTYTQEEAGALKLVDSGQYQCVFFMNPTLVEEVTAVAVGGEKMPQKSTYFYPKLNTGLVIRKL